MLLSSGCTARKPVSNPFFSAVSTAASDVPSLAHSAIKSAASGLFSAIFRAIGWLAATAMNEAPNKVSGRVVKTSICEVSGSVGLARLKMTRAPSDLPIQLACISRTRSGQRSSWSIAASRSSANSEIFKNHCDNKRRSTGAPDRQPQPSTTCSFASTVFSTGSQFTQLSLR